MSNRKAITFIVNPIAGTKSKGIFKDLITRHLDQTVFEAHLSYTEASGHAYELAVNAIREGKDAVVAVGGDGTINEVAQALVYKKTALGIVPFGSGNGLARHLGLPLNPALAIQTLNSQRKITIDAGKVNGKPFFCTAGVGFDAQVGKVFSLSTKRGFNTYVKTVLKEFMTYKTQHYKIEIPGREPFEKEAFSITFANAGQFGNNAYISPEADIADGKLDLCLIEKYPKTTGLHLGLRLFNRSIHKSKFMHIFPIEKARVTCPEANCYHLDGESFAMTGGELALEVIPKCLNVLVP